MLPNGARSRCIIYTYIQLYGTYQSVLQQMWCIHTNTNSRIYSPSIGTYGSVQMFTSFAIVCFTFHCAATISNDYVGCYAELPEFLISIKVWMRLKLCRFENEGGVRGNSAIIATATTYVYVLSLAHQFHGNAIELIEWKIAHLTNRQTRKFTPWEMWIDDGLHTPHPKQYVSEALSLPLPVPGIWFTRFNFKF